MNLTKEDILECIGLAYTQKSNESKVLDVDLAKSIVNELLKHLNKN